MARCPFAQWEPIPGTTTAGSYTSGPFKVVHHTTEGHRYQDARNAYIASNTPPHFTVDSTTIRQHIDTAHAARALRNPAGGVETNRDSAIQIEVVGFAGRPKDPETLAQVARLCRWIEETHNVPQRWPNGFPRPARNGRDPGGHNRNAVNWNTLGGHYGHCHVPENTHWDPAYTSEELDIVMDSADGRDNPINAEEIRASDLIQPAIASEALALPALPPVLGSGQKVPNRSEAASVGPFRGAVPRSSPTLVRNSNANIVFSNDEGNDDDRFMTRRLKEKMDILAGLVMQEWPDVRLRVTDAWDEGRGHSAGSRHYEGRAADMTTFPRDSSKLGRLCILAVEAGFDWVFYEDTRHIHASVKRDEDSHEALATESQDERLVLTEETQRDPVSDLRSEVEEREKEERRIESQRTALTPEEQGRLRVIGSEIPELEAALILLSKIFRR